LKSITKVLTVADLITENHYTQALLARRMGKSLTYISNRCTEKEPWTMDDILFITDLFYLSDDEMLQYFAHPSEKMKPRKRIRK
jgi:hypothetical protein